MPKKITKKQKERQKKLKLFIIAASILLCGCIAGIVTLCANLLATDSFEKIDRVKEIEKTRKKDKEGYKTIGWLRVQGTKIDTPIVAYEDVESLDNISIDDYLWNEDGGEKLYNRVNIQGHNILNLSANPEIGKDYFTRFDDLMSFVYLDFVKDNKYIQYTIDGKNYIYKIFAVYFEEKYNLDLYHKGNYDNTDIQTFIDKSKKASLYNFDIDVEKDDAIITLITCTRMYGMNDRKQFVVAGRMLRDDEKIENYKVEGTKNYDDLKEWMEGDKVDEENEI